MPTSIASGLTLFLFIFVVFIELSSSLICYDCRDCSLDTCICDKTNEIDNATNYCVIEQENTDVGTNIDLKNIGRNSTTNYVIDPFYISITEIIRFDEMTKKWITSLAKINFGCHTDRCNRPDLIQALSKSIVSFSLPEKWLDENIRRKPGATSLLCHDCNDELLCADKEHFINISRCLEVQCGGLCALSKFEKPNHPSEVCCESICANDPSELDTHQITINIIYYLNTKTFDFWEIDILCQAENCSRSEIFKDIENNLQKSIDPSAFLPNSASLHSISIFFLLAPLFVHLLDR